MEKTILKCIIIIMILFNFKYIYSQDGNEFPATIVPPSPSVSSLGKYVDVPVSNYTGVPNISIPIYEINGRKLSLPIYLSYHSSGVKVSESASWIGLGWSLNAGGVITRSMRGLPDDQEAEDNDPNVEYYLDNASFDNQKIVEGKQDAEPDLFYFNFAGYSGKFVFTKAGEVKLIPKTKLEVNYNRDDEGYIIEFIIKTPDGLIYTFNEIEKTVNETYGDSPGNYRDETWSYLDFGSFLGATKYISSWHLTKIETPSKLESIDFSYRTETIFDVSNGNEKYKDGEAIKKHTQTYTLAKKLERINWVTGYINFHSNHSRQDLMTHTDLFFNYPETPEMALTQIEIYNYENIFIKGYSLEYDYFNEKSDANETFSFLRKRLKLTSVTEYNESGEIKPPYEFTYNETALPRRDSYEQDYWGYYNGQENIVFRPNMYRYSTLDINNMYLSEYSIYLRSGASIVQVINDGANRAPDAEMMKAGIIETIKYPTGGYHEFTFEPHRFVFDGVGHIGGGLRVKKIEMYDDLDQIQKTIEYDYIDSDNSMSSGEIIFLPQYGVNDNNMIYTQTYKGLGTTKGSTVGYREVQVKESGNGYINYKYSVPMAFGSDPEDVPNVGIIFERPTVQIEYNTLYSSSICGSSGEYNLIPITAETNYDWKRGQLLEKIVFAEDSKKVLREVNKFEVDNTFDRIIGRNAAWFCKAESGGRFVYDINFADYYTVSAWIYPKSKTTFTYDPITQVEYEQNMVEYFYDNADHMQLTKTRITKSDGSIIYNEMKYPLDYDFSSSTISNLGQGASAIYKMQNELHMHALPIESFMWKYTTETHKDVINGTITSYKEFETDQVLPDQVFQLENNSLITDLEESSIESDRFEIDSRYGLQESYEYDVNGNLIENTIKNETSEAYIWGYNNSLPIAKSANARKSQVYFNNFEEDPGKTSATSKTGKYCRDINGAYSIPLAESQNLENGNYYLKYWWKADLNSDWELVEDEINGFVSGQYVYTSKTTGYIDDLRFHPKDAHMVTYTYDPLVGITSITNANYIVTYFEYDDFGRLTKKLDQDKNILEYNEYHYKE